MSKSFDIVVENPIHLTNEPVKTIGQILFEPFAGRQENCNLILSHVESEYIEISLFGLRLIVLDLIRDFSAKGIRKDQTVVLLTFHGCNEMFTAICFLALASMGCRVFMPMYSETVEFSDWIDLTRAAHIILPEGEILSLESHEREKSAIRGYNAICNMTFGKDHRTYELALGILNEEIQHEAWFSEFIGEGPSGHFQRPNGVNSP